MWSTGVGFTLFTYHPGAWLSQPAELRALMKHGLFYLHCHHPSLFLFLRRSWRLPPSLVVWVTAITAQLRTEASAGEKRWSCLIFHSVIMAGNWRRRGLLWPLLSCPRQPDMDDTNFINLCGLVASLDIPFPVYNQTKCPCCTDLWEWQNVIFSCPTTDFTSTPTIGLWQNLKGYLLHI